MNKTNEEPKNSTETKVTTERYKQLVSGFPTYFDNSIKNISNNMLNPPEFLKAIEVADDTSFYAIAEAHYFHRILSALMHYIAKDDVSDVLSTDDDELQQQIMDMYMRLIALSRGGEREEDCSLYSDVNPTGLGVIITHTKTIFGNDILSGHDLVNQALEKPTYELDESTDAYDLLMTQVYNVRMPLLTARDTRNSLPLLLNCIPMYAINYNVKAQKLYSKDPSVAAVHADVVIELVAQASNPLIMRDGWLNDTPIKTTFDNMYTGILGPQGTLVKRYTEIKSEMLPELNKYIITLKESVTNFYENILASPYWDPSQVLPKELEIFADRG